MDITPEQLEHLKNFKPKIPTLPKHTVKKPVQIMARIKLNPKGKIKEYTPKQLKDYKKAKTPEGKMDALEIKVGKRANLDIKKKTIARLWKTEHLIKRNPVFSEQRKYIEALATHIAGETIVDSALMYGLQADKLNRFKHKFMQIDSMLPQFIEGLFEQATISALAIWNDKKEGLSAKDAALSAGIFAEKVILLKKARKTDYVDENISLATLQRLATVINKVAILQKGETIDVDAEVKQITDHDTSKD